MADSLVGCAHQGKVKFRPMITRIHIDNFRCFVNFEYKPDRKQLIVGPNGAGKSSLLDAILFLRRVVVLGHQPDIHRILDERTLWVNQPNQTFELEAELDDNAIYVYRLVINSSGDPPKARVVSESVKLRENRRFKGESIFDFQAGEVRLFDDQFHQTFAYPFDPHRSALATVTEMKDNRKLIRFKRWFNGLLVFRINPFAMGARAEREDPYPYFDLSNFAAWYRHLLQSSPRENAKLLDSLGAALDNFSSWNLRTLGRTSAFFSPNS